MSIKNCYKKLLRILILISIFEVVYLLAVPRMMEHFINKDTIKNAVKAKTNAEINYSRIKVKTHILPYLTFKTKDISLFSQEDESPLINARDVDVKISILPLLRKKLNLKHIYSSNTDINITRNSDGQYNFENLFKKENKKPSFKIHYGSLVVGVQNYKLNLNDEFLNQHVTFDGAPFLIKNKLKKNYFTLNTEGNILNKQSEASTYEINLKAGYPKDYKHIGKDLINGKCILYNVDLNPIFPVVQKLTNNQIKKFGGYVDYIQFSADKTANDKTQVSLNTQFKDVIFDKEGWENYIQANGENKVDASVDLKDDVITLNSFHYKADKVNIRSNGKILVKKNPDLDIDIEVKDSRTENIASILPPTLVPEYRTIEKVKRYGLYGDMNGKVNIKGTVPHPNITGFATGRNLHILDEPMHKLHTGTVDLVFDKNILNMDILVDMFNNQKARIKGYTYMYRDGVNDVKIETTDNIDFPLAQKIVVPISKVFNFMLGPIPDMNITSGKGVIDMRIRGSIDFIDMHGYSKFDKAALTYNGLYANIHNGKGRLDFDGDVISFKSDKVYVKNNFIDIDGKVKINDNLDFNISSNKAEAKDVLELVNKSPLLKDVKAGLAVITSASGPMNLKLNINSKIVPVPFGQPPLPPEEAFVDMKVKGKADLLNNNATIIGFDTPLHDIKGDVDFSETITDINNIDAVCLKSPINIKGKIINDIKTKTPDVDIIITGDKIYYGDTVQFLTRSYMYPDFYPDLSSLYNLNSQHDLYFKYKAKSKDFLTSKAYAVMNFIKDTSDSPLKAKDGRIIMKNANVFVEDVDADLLGANLKINGDVKRVDTLKPLYNLDIKADKFNLENLNNIDNYSIVPNEAKSVISAFKDFSGYADMDITLNRSIISGNLNVYNPKFIHTQTGIPFNFDDFTVNINNDKVSSDNISGNIGSMPLFTKLNLSNIYREPALDGYFTTKLTNDFVQKYLPKEISSIIKLVGDINLSSDIKGTQKNLNILPKLTFYPDSDVIVDNISLGETADTREFSGSINLTPNEINVHKLDYIKYIASQNNTEYPVVFATGNGILTFNKAKNTYIPKELKIKTEKNLPAKLLNVFLKKPIFKQGSLSCDMKYIFDEANKTAKVFGEMDSRNLDIPLFDTVVKNIKIEAKNDDINIDLFGFMNDSRIKLSSLLKNNLYYTPKVKSLILSADEINNDKLFRSLSQVRKAMTSNNEIKNVDFNGINIENAKINIKKLIIKSLVAENLKSSFSIDANGIFNADNITVDVGQGNIEGTLRYDLTSSAFKGDFELTNVDSSYIAETLFDGKNQIYGNANGKIVINSQGYTDEEIIKNLSGFILFEITDGRMPKLGSLEYLLRASNIIKSGITGLTINSILGLLNLVKTGYFSNINGSCIIEDGVAENIEIFSTGENLSLYIHGDYDIADTEAHMEILGKLSNRISTIFGTLGNTSLNTFFKLIPGISLFDFGRKDFIEDVEKIPSFTNGDYDARVFQAIIDGDINSSNYVQSFKWVRN